MFTLRECKIKIVPTTARNYSVRASIKHVADFAPFKTSSSFPLAKQAQKIAHHRADDENDKASTC